MYKMECYRTLMLWEGYQLRRKFGSKDEQVFEAVELANGQQLVAIKIDMNWMIDYERQFYDNFVDGKRVPRVLL